MSDRQAYCIAHIIAFVVFLICVAIVICISQCSMPQATHTEISYNLDSLRRVDRVIEERKRQSQLKTREDSIHYFEDGY